MGDRFREFHLDPQDYDRTLRRNARCATVGIPMLPHLPAMLVTDEDTVIRDLVAAYHAASRSPRPNVIVVRGAASA